MTRGEHPSDGLRCSVEGCDRRAFEVSSSGRLLCEDCFSFSELEWLSGGGFWEWIRRRILRRA